MAPPQAPTGWYATGLEDILPRRGFTYPAGHKVFARERDSILIKWALQSKEAHRSETGVDHALGAIMNDAIAIADGVWKDERQRLMDGANSPLRVPLAAIFESARKFYSWTEMVGDDLFPYLMLDLIRARRTYRLLVRQGQLADSDGEYPGELAAAIDGWRDPYPAAFDDETIYATSDWSDTDSTSSGWRFISNWHRYMRNKISARFMGTITEESDEGGPYDQAIEAGGGMLMRKRLAEPDDGRYKSGLLADGVTCGLYSW